MVKGMISNWLKARYPNGWRYNFLMVEGMVSKYLKPWFPNEWSLDFQIVKDHIYKGDASFTL